jgi:hypothetical protein
MAEITALCNFLNNDLMLNDTNITPEAISGLIATDQKETSPTKSINLNQLDANLPAIIKKLTSLNLTSLSNLKVLQSLATFNVHSVTGLTENFALSNLTDIAINNTNLTTINLYGNSICIKDSIDKLNNLTLGKLNVSYVASGHLSVSDTLTHANTMLMAGVTIDDSANPNKMCGDPKSVTNTNIHVDGLNTPCSSGCSSPPTPTNLCITSVSISGTSLVIQTGGCDTTTILNTPVSDSTDVSYTKCNNCGNIKTLLRNEVDEVVDDSSALYNRDSNNEVCNHCLVSIGDEKHCNRFLDKEDCNYLGDSYAWVGA